MGRFHGLLGHAHIGGAFRDQDLLLGGQTSSCIKAYKIDTQKGAINTRWQLNRAYVPTGA